MASDVEEMTEIMQANQGDEKLSQFQLPRIKVPSGGHTQWELPSIGKPVYAESFTGIIIAHRINRSYWSRGLGEGGENAISPPDCSSPDGIQGYGVPGIKCAECKLAGFDNPAGRPACKKTHVLFIMRPTDMLPTVLSVPPTSLKNIQDYLLGLTQQGAVHYGVTSTFALEKQVSRNGQPFAKVTVAFGEKLSPEERQQAREYHKAIDAMLSREPSMTATPQSDLATEDLTLA